jgi:raffinose/stachyose/melibiose transport system permease protein
LKKKSLAGILGNAFIGIYSLFILLPIYFIIVTSLKSKADINLKPLGFPLKPVFQNFVDAFIQGHIARSSLNSFVITSGTIIISMIVTILLSFGIYKMFHKKVGSIIYSFIMFGMMVAPVGFVNLIILYQQMHLYNNLIGVIFNLAANSIPFSVFLLVGQFRSIPKDLQDASTIDGCNEMQTLMHILVPLSKPTITTILILNLVMSWNNLLSPLLLIRSEKIEPIPLSLLTFRGNYSISYNLLFAGVIITAIPLVILFIKFQKNFIESLSGSMKG